MSNGQRLIVKIHNTSRARLYRHGVFAFDHIRLRIGVHRQPHVIVAVRSDDSVNLQAERIPSHTVFSLSRIVWLC